MAIQLYKAGDTHEVRGIKCEVRNFTNQEYGYWLENGWYLDPKDIPLESVEEAKEEVEEEKELHPVRLAAKDAGIDGYEKKRIKTLEGELDELKD